MQLCMQIVPIVQMQQGHMLWKHTGRIPLQYPGVRQNCLHTKNCSVNLRKKSKPAHYTLSRGLCLAQKGEHALDRMQRLYYGMSSGTLQWSSHGRGPQSTRLILDKWTMQRGFVWHHGSKWWILRNKIYELGWATIGPASESVLVREKVQQ